MISRKEKFLIESQIGLLLQAPPIILKNDRHQLYYLLVDMQCAYGAL